MRRVTASDARKNWFRILDEVAAGDVVVVDRGGRRIVIKRENIAAEPSLPDYAGLIHAPHAAEAERWSWEWQEAEGEVRPVEVEDE